MTDEIRSGAWMFDEEDLEGAELQSFLTWSRKMALEAAGLSDREAGFIVYGYYMTQDTRKRADNQILALKKAGDPHGLVLWVAQNSRRLENNIKAMLDKYSAAQPLGEWARGLIGMGPVLTSGLLAHIDVTEAKTAGAVWRFAGLDPSQEWVSAVKAAAFVAEHGVSPDTAALAADKFGLNTNTILKFALHDAAGNLRKLTAKNLASSISRRPYNAQLKTLCWKLGESFVKVSRKGSLYGELYANRKALEIERNDAGEFKAQAHGIAKKVPNHKQIASYKVGRLPDGHLHSRAKRHAVKIFLAHFLEKGRILKDLPVVKPYAITILGHAHEITLADAT